MDRSRTPAGSDAGSDVLLADLLVSGSAGSPASRRWPARAGWVVLGVVLAVALAWQLVPHLAQQLRPAPATGVALVLTGSERGRLDADSGRFEPAPGPAGLDAVSLPVATLAPGGRIPSGRTVVGTVDGGLVLRHGELRAPVFELYDPSAGHVVRRFGGLGWVLATGGPVMTAALPCWAGDCPVVVVDTGTGRRARLVPPDGTTFSGRVVPSADGRRLAAVVRPLDSGTGVLAVGPTFGPLHVVDAVVAEPGTTVVWGSGPAATWLAVPAGDGRVRLWRPGTAPHDVALPDGTTVVTVVAQG